MGEVFMWNLIILLWATAFFGFLGETGERWLTVQVVFYNGLFISIGWWFIVVAVRVGTS